MHYILCSDNRITYTLIINDYSCKCGLAIEYLDVEGGMRKVNPNYSGLDKSAMMMGVENGVFNDC